MLTINLLPPQEKKYLEMELNSRLLLALGGGIALILILFSLLLEGTIRFVNIQLVPLKEEITFEEKRKEAREVVNIERELLALGNDLTRIKTFSEQQKQWLGVLGEIAALPREGIIFKTLLLKGQSVPREDGTAVFERQVTILGHAQRRDEHLVPFESALRNNPKISKVQSERASIYKEENIDFTVSFVISP